MSPDSISFDRSRFSVKALFCSNMTLAILFSVASALSTVVAASDSPRSLAPARDIVSWEGAHSEAPLEWLGANSPWFSGPNVHKISTDVPDSCTVDQAAYVSRHGSRYPDSGAYAEWKEMESRVRIAN